MTRTLIKDLQAHIDQNVTISGWVDVRRDHGKLMFVDLRDRSGTVQLVILPSHQDAHKIAQAIRSEWVISITGEVHARPEHMRNEQQMNGDLEIEVSTVEVLAKAQELPFERNTQVNLDTLFDYRPLTLRNEREQGIFRVQSEIVKAYSDSLRNNDFVEFQAPKIVGVTLKEGQVFLNLRI